MPDGLYETDSLNWAERQSTLLLRLSRGERVNDAIDWPHVIEEIHDVGLSELHACESLLAQAVLHLLRIKGWPSGPARHWGSEVLVFLADARRRFAPSMRQRIALDSIYASARDALMILEIDGAPPATLPDDCPYALNDLLAAKPDLARLIGPA